MFTGRSALSLDGKGRMTLPVKWRAPFADVDGTFVVLTRHPDGCLLLFQRSMWAQFAQKIAALPMSARDWQRMFLGNASEQEVDASGRLLIPPELREAVGLDKDVVMMGQGTKYEIWDAARLKARDATLEGKEPPESIANFTI